MSAAPSEMGFLACAAPLAPRLQWQGRAARRETPHLAEPGGTRAASFDAGVPLRLLLLGDSAAAGIGAPHQTPRPVFAFASRPFDMPPR